MMKLWLISQDKIDGYDVYDSAVVAAETEESARMTHPSPLKREWDGKKGMYPDWADAKDVKVELIGDAAPNVKPGVICASYNAG